MSNSAEFTSHSSNWECSVKENWALCVCVCVYVHLHVRVCVCVCVCVASFVCLSFWWCWVSSKSGGGQYWITFDCAALLNWKRTLCWVPAIDVQLRSAISKHRATPRTPSLHCSSDPATFHLLQHTFTSRSITRSHAATHTHTLTHIQIHKHHSDVYTQETYLKSTHSCSGVHSS